jgi:hypothetical protein
MENIDVISSFRFKHCEQSSLEPTHQHVPPAPVCPTSHVPGASSPTSRLQSPTRHKTGLPLRLPSLRARRSIREPGPVGVRRSRAPAGPRVAVGVLAGFLQYWIHPTHLRQTAKLWITVKPERTNHVIMTTTPDLR